MLSAKPKIITCAMVYVIGDVMLCRTKSRWHIDSTITGQTSVKQLEEYLGAFDITLDQETFKEVERIHKENRCPQWVD